MELDKALESAPEWYWIEMAGAAKKMVEEVFPVKPGENVVVTADTQSDWRGVKEVVKAIYAIGATPTLILHPMTETASMDPPPPVSAAVQACDAWIALEENYLIYSDAWNKAMKAGVRAWFMLSQVDMLVKMVGRVNYAVLDRLANKLIELTNRATEMRVTSASGTNLRFKVDPKCSIGHVLKGGERESGIRYEGEGLNQIAPGQAVIGHVPDSVEGTLVLDGFIYPPEEIGVLHEPVRLEISRGRITDITGGREARTFKKWLAGWNHPGMYVIAHCVCGFNPGAKRCKGDAAQDERVFGCMEYGMGAKWEDAPAHSDGGMLEPSVWADEIQLEDEGRYVHPELAALCRELGVEGY